MRIGPKSNHKPIQGFLINQNSQAKHFCQNHLNQESNQIIQQFQKPRSSKQLESIKQRNILLNPKIVNKKQEILTNYNLKFSSFVWPYGIIPYIIDISFTEKMRQYLFKAIKEFQEKTSIKFVQKQDFKKHNQYVKYTKSSNGRSFVFKLGRQIQEKEHVVHIEENSDYGTYLHETMHVLGFDHTQCRIDRDLYLSFQQSQLDPEDMNQYQIREMGYMIGEYDFDSTMHYGQSEYMTLKAEYQHKNIGFRQQLSDGDIKGIEFIYGNSQCTYDVSSNNKYEQIYYECITCWGKNSIFGACRICALICHKDHQIIKKSGSFSCHCGKQDHRVQLCTRESAGQQRVQQPMYLCLDCFDIKKYQQNHDGATPGVCHACAIKCHKLHNLQFYGVATDFYCDCGLTASETDCRAK